MQFDTAFKFAVLQGWEDLRKVAEPCLIRVEYQGEPGTSMDYLRIWSDRGGGYQNLVCDYCTGSSPAHPSGVRFTNGYQSEGLGQTLDFIMKNQGQFTRRADACRDGLILIYPPTGDQSAEAAAWVAEDRGAATKFEGAPDESAPLPGAPVPMEGRS